MRKSKRFLRSLRLRTCTASCLFANVTVACCSLQKLQRENYKQLQKRQKINLCMLLFIMKANVFCLGFYLFILDQVVLCVKQGKGFLGWFFWGFSLGLGFFFFCQVKLRMLLIFCFSTSRYQKPQNFMSLPCLFAKPFSLAYTTFLSTALSYFLWCPS